MIVKCISQSAHVTKHFFHCHFASCTSFLNHNLECRNEPLHEHECQRQPACSHWFFLLLTILLRTWKRVVRGNLPMGVLWVRTFVSAVYTNGKMQGHACSTTELWARNNSHGVYLAWVPREVEKFSNGSFDLSLATLNTALTSLNNVRDKFIQTSGGIERSTPEHDDGLYMYKQLKRRRKRGNVVVGWGFGWWGCGVGDEDGAGWAQS